MTPPYDVLNEFGRRLVERFGPLSVELAVLSVVVIVVLALLRPKSPAVRHLFWCLVLIKPLATNNFSTGVAKGYIAEFVMDIHTSTCYI